MTIIHGGRWQKIDPSKEMHLGHQHERNGQRAIDKKCDYCGKWITFDVKNVHFWGDNIKMGFNGVPEKVHCGSTHCLYYHRRVKLHEKKEKERFAAQRANGIFRNLKAQGMVA